MDAADAGRLRALLADPGVVAVDPLTVERLQRRLASADGPPPITVEPHGTLVVREPRPGGSPRRVLELDRGGAALAALRWTDDGRLARAWTRIADDSWAMIEPRAADEAPWGAVDRVWHAPHPSHAAPVPLTVFEALAYERIDRIPILAEPARLPRGAGTAILNLVAALAADAGSGPLRYHGPYPTEQLFLALLESFRHEGDASDPLAAFMDGRVAWSPAPHERIRHGADLTVHLRGRVERVAWRGRTYERPETQGVRRHAPRRVRDVGDAAVCSLWALGESVEDHLRLTADGTAAEVLARTTRATRAVMPLPPVVLAGITAAIAALGAAPLAPFVRDVAAGCVLGWASLDGDLVAFEGTRLSVSHALRDTLARRLATASTRPQRLALALAALTELAHLFGDTVRARAQSRIAGLPPDTQARLLTDPPAPDLSAAQQITDAVEALLADVTSARD